ncbi:hypothetical protein [Pajaroellobacter abortibovis]|nr:hypothetical protein [Pajaroellobacter abortibovis]
MDVYCAPNYKDTLYNCQKFCRKRFDCIHQRVNREGEYRDQPYER